MTNIDAVGVRFYSRNSKSAPMGRKETPKIVAVQQNQAHPSHACLLFNYSTPERHSIARLNSSTWQTPAPSDKFDLPNQPTQPAYCPSLSRSVSKRRAQPTEQISYRSRPIFRTLSDLARISPAFTSDQTRPTRTSDRDLESVRSRNFSKYFIKSRLRTGHSAPPVRRHVTRS